jgi:FKBP-type peptidyl-prolyl cis-trans isomerase
MKFWVVMSIILLAVIGFVVYGGNQAKQASSSSSSSTSSVAVSSSPAIKQGVAVLTEIKKDDITIGTGAQVQPGANVTVNYRGTLTDGTEFDSSYSRNQPATFSLSQVIKGWQDGIPGMQVGGKRKLSIPAAQAYGSQSPSAIIPANSDLYFEVELISIN